MTVTKAMYDSAYKLALESIQTSPKLAAAAWADDIVMIQEQTNEIKRLGKIAHRGVSGPDEGESDFLTEEQFKTMVQPN